MSLPVLSKSWQFDVNQPCIMNEGGRSFLLLVKNSLVSRLGTRPEVLSRWTVAQSSDGVTVSTDDLWVGDESLVWGTPNAPEHSWMVLAQPGLTTKSELCIDLVDDDNVCFVWAPEGFEGGTMASRPTSPTEVVVYDSSGAEAGLAARRWGGAPSMDDEGVIVHVMQSTDGACTRVAFYGTGDLLGAFLLERVNRPVANWRAPIAMYIAFGEEQPLSYGTLQTTETPRVRGYGVRPMRLFLTSEAFGDPGAAVGEKLLGPNDLDGHWPLAPIGLASLDSGQRGRHGELFDLWFSSVGAPELTTYPADGSRQLVQFGHLVFPWDGTSEVLGSSPEK